MIDSPEKRASAPDTLSGGEMGRRIREFDWSKTSLGSRNKWSETLKSTVSIMLINRFPMLLWWGKDYVQLYNDVYIPVLGMKHPHPALGSPGSACWQEIWDVLAPLVDTPFNGGPPTLMDDILLKINRNNRVEETHFTIAYSPVPDPTVESGIGGVLATVKEISAEIISRRQMETLSKLGKGISSTPTEEEVYKHVATVLEENKFDVPFAFIHTLDDNSRPTLAVTAGIDRNHPIVQPPGIIDNSLTAVLIDEHFDNLPMGAWDHQPRTLIHLPIRGSKGKPAAVLTIAQSPFRQFDELYRNFVQLISDQVSFGVSTANAFRQEQERAKALAEVDKAKTQFFGNVSHEFRTPLTLMLGPINDLLSKDSSSAIIADRDTLTLVQRNALRLQKLVNSLLDFSRIEAGKYRAYFQPVDISRLTAELASNFHSLMSMGGLQFEIDCPKLSEPVYVDSDMWEKIVLNLISNAFKFTFEGKISIKLEAIGDHIELSVADSGVGISKEDLTHLFERFHRIENVRSRTHEGSGIGLALVNELVKMHGGKTDVSSIPGKGTRFTVSIPLGVKHLPAEQIGEVQTSTAIKPEAFKEEAARWIPDENENITTPVYTGKPRVLLAEDNADMQMYIKSILGEFCDVYSVPNGRVALMVIGKVRPDLVLTDIMMPEIDGLGLLKALRNDEDHRSVPVILLTARAGEEARIEGLESGADDYLTKPFNRNELMARVRSNLQLSRVRREVQAGIKLSEARLRALVNATSDVIYRMSPDWTIMRQLDGRSFLKDAGLPLSNWDEKYIHPKDRERLWQVIHEAIRNKAIFQFEHQVIRNDGTLGWTFSRAIPILDDNGEIIEWFGAASDISVRKFYENELEARVEDRTRALNKANSELKVSNDDLQQFAHVASHDLKEPLRKIKTFALRLKEEQGEALPDKGKTYVERVLNAADRMSTMIDGVLNYSSLNGGGFMLEIIDLNAIIKNIQNDLELMIDQKKATLVFGGLPEIQGGKVLIHQLFYNLINNSLKFSEDGRPPVIRIDAQKDTQEGVRMDVISVSDNGIGFDQTQSVLIFETFTRLHSKDKYDGTGLGLALCKKIVERHNGYIRAEGKRDVGAKFIIGLPALHE